MASEASAATAPAVGLPRLLATFVRLGIVTFGGGLQSWIHREVVDRLGWVDDATFLSGLTVARVVPGPNGVNVALCIGLKLRGAVGAAVAVLGMIIPAFSVILCLGYLYRSFGHVPEVRFVLTGLAAAGVGATLTMGIKVGRCLPRDLGSSVTAVGVFALVGLLRLPMIAVVLAVIPVSVGLALLAERKPRDES